MGALCFRLRAVIRGSYACLIKLICVLLISTRATVAAVAAAVDTVANTVAATVANTVAAVKNTVATTVANTVVVIAAVVGLIATMASARLGLSSSFRLFSYRPFSPKLQSSKVRSFGSF